jgi:class 3 adenylate cyclase
MRGALTRHDAIVRKAVDPHGGTVFATMGDGMAVVSKTRLAVQAAADLLPSFAEGAWLRQQASNKKARACWERVTAQYPRLFAHGAWVPNSWWSG